MKKPGDCGLSSRLLTQLELKTFTRIGEAYSPGFRTQAASDKIDDFLKAMSPSDYWMFRSLLIAGTVLPPAVFRWIARCEDDTTGAMRYRVSARLHFPLKAIVLVLRHGDNVVQQIADSRREILQRSRNPA